MTETTRRRILGDKTWPIGKAADDLEDLFAIFDCDDLGILEDRLHTLLPEDPGDLHIDYDGGSITIRTAGVSMWSLLFPITADRFDMYLFELDERMTLQKLLWELPDAEAWEDDGEPSIVPQLAALLRTTPEKFSAALGDDWRPLDLDWVGSGSHPTNYLWTGASVVGLDNCNAYLYCPAKAGPSMFDLDGVAYREVAWVDEIWSGTGPSLDWFAPFVQCMDAGEGRGSCPSCGSGRVTHVLFGFPADPDALPSWVRLGGCVIDAEVKNRYCESCGHKWNAVRDDESVND